MDAWTLIDAICYTLAFLVSWLFFAAPFTTRGRTAPHWIRVALWLSFATALAWSTLGFTLLITSHVLSAHLYHYLDHIKAVIAGSGLGILVLLFISGEFPRAFGRSTGSSASS